MIFHTILDAFSRFLCLDDVDWDNDFPHDGYRDVFGRQPVIFTQQERRIMSLFTGNEIPAQALDVRPHLQPAQQASGK